MRGYRELKVWQLGVEISLEVYRLTESLPSREMYGLTSQMRRAAISIPSNIAEGHSRGQTKDLIQFLAISRGSVSELETQLIIAEKLGYIQQACIRHVVGMLDEESRMLAGLQRSLRSKLNR
jgi:four helix bundle protein